jgi:ketosteroid isomerase-like protein
MFQRERPLLPRPICFEAVQSKVKENIMNQREIVQTVFDSVQKGDFVKTKSLLADDFQFSGPLPEPIDREAWVGMNTRLQAAFPDLDYHFHVIGADDDIVNTTSQLSGTHTGSFDLTNMKMGVIPATRKAFSAKAEKTKITVKDNKITSWAVEPTEGAGLKEILGQLGVAGPTK